MKDKLRNQKRERNQKISFRKIKEDIRKRIKNIRDRNKKKIAKERKVIPDPIDDRKFHE